MEENKFKVVVIGIIFNPEERKILVGKNKEDSQYTFLEGNLKQDEELDVGLKRVTFEKTGYKVHNLGAIYARNNIEGKKDVLELYFLCEATEGKEKPGESVEELKWIKPSEVEDITNQNLRQTLKDYILSLE